MPSNSEKKTVQIGVKIPESLNEQIETIAVKEARRVGEVARLLMIRALALYRIDGKLVDDNSFEIEVESNLRPKTTSKPVKAQKAALQRQVFGEETDDVIPIPDGGSIGKRDPIRKTRIQ